MISTSSSQRKLDFAKSLGATHVINYAETPDWDQEVLKLTNGKGVDIVVETGGAGTLTPIDQTPDLTADHNPQAR